MTVGRWEIHSARLWVASVCSVCVVSVLRIVLVPVVVPVVQSIVVGSNRSSIYSVEFVIYLSLKGWRRVSFQFLVRLFVVNKFVHLVVVVSFLSMTTVTRPLSAGSITMFSPFFSRFSACFSSFVKLLFNLTDDLPWC